MNRSRKRVAKTEVAERPVPARRTSRPASSIGDYLRRQRELANISLRKMAAQSGISAALLSEIETGLRHPSQAILQSLAGVLRLSAETLYLQAGVLDPEDIEDSATVREIRRDPNLTTRQRETLFQVYEAFRTQNKS
jgi:transcriptional regulator with XRE-family HTH domain